MWKTNDTKHRTFILILPAKWNRVKQNKENFKKVSQNHNTARVYSGNTNTELYLSDVENSRHTHTAHILIVPAKKTKQNKTNKF
jgi:hypothetical protein